MPNPSAILILLMGAAALAQPSPRIRPSAANPFYWEYGGRTVLLAGASDDDNLFPWPDKELAGHLKRLAGAGRLGAETEAEGHGWLEVSAPSRGNWIAAVRRR